MIRKSVPEKSINEGAPSIINRYRYGFIDVAIISSRYRFERKEFCRCLTRVDARTDSTDALQFTVKEKDILEVVAVSPGYVRCLKSDAKMVGVKRIGCNRGAKGRSQFGSISLGNQVWVAHKREPACEGIVNINIFQVIYVIDVEAKPTGKCNVSSIAADGWRKVVRIEDRGRTSHRD